MSKFNQIQPQESEYAKVLENIALVPKTLYYWGDLPRNRIKTVAIVGARRNTRYGEEIAYKMAFELAKHGIIVISGLAYGIDSVAHRGALDGGGITIGVLGTEIENIYPRQHEELARKIVAQGGAVISEYKKGDKFFPKISFLQRNRIIAGLADVVVVVEAAEKSGSLNTAMHALEQGKELLAVPGDINRPLSAGCNALIKQGANPYTSPEDVLSILFPVPKKRKNQQQMIFGDTEEETEILKLVSEGVRDGEEIMARLKMDVGAFNRTITMLEIKGRVRSLGANNWTLG